MSDTVLIVDDEPELREILAFDFESAGFAVVTAESATMALEILARETIRAVVSDIRMANGDGIQLLKSVRPWKVEKGLLLMLITGYSDFSIQDALDQGADGFFLKPFSRRSLVGAVQRQLAHDDEKWCLPPEKNQKNAIHEFTLEFAGFDDAVREKSLNLGRGGLFLAGDVRGRKPDEVVKLNITFGADPQNCICGEGVIRWVRHTGTLGFGLGVEFVRLDEESRKFVLGVQRRLKPLAFIPKA